MILYSDIVLDAVYQPGKQVENLLLRSTRDHGQDGQSDTGDAESSRGTGRRDAWRHASDASDSEPGTGVARGSEARDPMEGGDPNRFRDSEAELGGERRVMAE